MAKKVNIYYDQDADAGLLTGKTVAILGYGSQGNAQALCLRDSGVTVVIGVRPGGESAEKAGKEGFRVLSFAEAAQAGDIIHMLLPDELHGSVYEQHVKKHLRAGKVLSCSHGFNIVYKQVMPPSDVDVILVAPKSPGSEERKRYLEGTGVPGLLAVKQDASGQAKAIGLALARAMKFTKAGVLECTFEEETYEDLFGEQTVLCGGTVELIKAGFEVLTEAGYPPEMAYYEVLHEMKLIVDLIYESGIEGMNNMISNTAEWGEYSVGPKIITPQVKKSMRAALKAIENGAFARQWIAEFKKGSPNLLKKRKSLAKHPIEVVGRKLRAMMPWLTRK